MKRRSGGRPPKLRSEQIQDEILDIAAGLFLAQGYGSVSIEKIAAECGISKRTFYHRFKDKKELFSAVVQRLISRLRPRETDHLFKGGTLEAVLLRLADLILDAALTPEALALHRIIIAEAVRFPELAAVMETEGSREEAVLRIAQLLDHEMRAGNIRLHDTRFAAQQFLQMIIGVPQRRALGSDAMTPEERALWKTQTVSLFLNGCKAKA